jgi:putative DNA primase/helicase
VEAASWFPDLNITSDISRLRGTRFVTTTEANQGKRLSEPLIKQDHR